MPYRAALRHVQQNYMVDLTRALLKLTDAIVGDHKGIADADRAAKRKALDIIEGKIIAGSVAQLIERFRDEIAPTQYLDQSKDGLAVRESGYKNLTKFFGKIDPKSLRMLHGYLTGFARPRCGRSI